MIYACKETKEEWGRIPARDRSRTLAAARFIDFEDGNSGVDWRRRTSSAVKDGGFDFCKISHWNTLVSTLVGGPEGILFGKLQARLIVNAAGGVLENGGMSLDRNSGVPFIPGSAVKGCARKWVIKDLRRLAEEGASREEITALLISAALVFGWTEMDWKPGKNDKDQHCSDFWWACRDDEQIIEEAAGTLLNQLGVKINEEKPAWKQLPNYAGSVNFLPAFPWDKDPSIDLDIITCHHTNYYKGDILYAAAPDTEEPNPVVFPVVSADKEPVFAFVVIANALGSSEMEKQARIWLASSLEILGIGGKTSAGYGWFDCSEDLQSHVRQEFKNEIERHRAEYLRKQDVEKQKREEEDKKNREKAKQRLTEGMTPEQKNDWEISQLSEQQFLSKLYLFDKLEKSEQRSLQKALRQDRVDIWKNIKVIAEKGMAKEKKRWNPIIQAIFIVAKEAREKMP